MLTKIINTLKNDRRKIVFTEGEDPRILEAATRLVADGIMDVLLCGNPEKVKAAAAAGGFKLDGIEIADPAGNEKLASKKPLQVNTKLPEIDRNCAD